MALSYQPVKVGDKLVIETGHHLRHAYSITNRKTAAAYAAVGTSP